MKLLLALLCVLHVTLAAAAPPNIVIFLADDAGWGDYSQSGNTQVRTPHIDSIAQGGVSFDRFYVCPVCSPTRASAGRQSGSCLAKSRQRTYAVIGGVQVPKNRPPD